ncbi:hypothetical protein [Enterococcus cecorum]|uniref:hypothetical protein n=1 Tax=Enterococcus cecorum TaxID=44008 RepID=UPI001FAD448D|nr:hypothetical protein [Enterococcus cecorum]MCJ0537694.1 hypothetical protein [Enterococcus cecorum]MCJ0547263.1 hypothetical protein [Enterococcus cecorum]MCJ0551633.1 hypothetical protein [Enterococcus cecorum]MCJ0570507.1 hypothetical protein [Enterococcus cecorum]
MSNLGGYKWLTTTAKKVGGPENLVLLIAGTGAIVYKGSEVVVKKSIKKIKKRMSNKFHSSKIKDLHIYTVNTDVVSMEGVEFKKGDQFRVLEVDKEVVMIEIIGNNNNPFFVTNNFLRKISDYKF